MQKRLLLCFLTAAAVGHQRPPARVRPYYDDPANVSVSPEVHPDRRVTFRLLAPKASELLLVGGDLGRLPGAPHVMHKDDKGVWSVTVGPLAPDIYNYGYSIDGSLRATDPSNPNLEPLRWGSLSYVEVPADKPAYYDPRPVPHGVVQIHWYHSKALQQARRLFVYTPPDFDKDPKATYPALYLLHGSGQVEELWTRMGRANFIMDNLIADGKARPMLVVMPYGHVHRQYTREEVAGGRDDPRMFERELLEEIIPYVESRFRVRRDRNSRALCGLSMGGSQSLLIGLNHPEVFAWVGSFSAGGARSDHEVAYAKLIADPEASNRRLRLLWIACGKQDQVWEASQRLSEYLRRKGIRHVFHATEGHHSWQVWRPYLRDFASLLFRPQQGSSGAPG